ncbi:MAG: EFR1 family ferrodoxin [Bilifractor sp.]|jgi:ferredoxin
MKILYFTASGNCLAVAKRFEAERYSIPQMIKENRYILEDDVIGIIYPVYGFGIPGIVIRYLKQATLKADYIFVIATYGNMDGATLHEMKKLLESNGNRADYYRTLLMVDNYLPGFDIRDQLAKLPEKDIEGHLSGILEDVRQRKKRYVDKGFGWNIITSVFNNHKAGIMSRCAEKLFSVSDDCIGCGLCSRVCPVGNVTQTEKNKPVFSDHCESCFACVHNCPERAIHIKGEKSKERFRNPDVSAEEIVEANMQ